MSKHWLKKRKGERSQLIQNRGFALRKHKLQIKCLASAAGQKAPRYFFGPSLWKTPRKL